MSTQWLRRLSLTLGGDGTLMDLSALRIRFDVRRSDSPTPASADLRITNPSPQTAEAARKEFTRLVLQAGYQDNVATIFEGGITQMRFSRENATDSLLDIMASDGGEAHDYAVINKTLAAGHGLRDQLDACLAALAPFGITAGTIADLGGATMPRAAVLFGMVRDHLRNIAQAADCSWSIAGGRLTFVKNEEYIPGTAILVNRATGLIGTPSRTIEGVEVRTLLNPQIQPGRRLQLDQGAGALQAAAASTAAMADDGLYKVLSVHHSGDTRDTPYYTDAVCIRADGDGPLPAGLAARGVVLQRPDA